MRITLTLMCFSLLSAGCMSTHAEQQTLRKLMADYQSIEKGMTEEEVIARLGAPKKSDNAEAFTLHWRQDPSLDPTSGHYAALDVSFDGDGRVSEANFRLVRVAHYDANPFPGSGPVFQ